MTFAYDRCLRMVRPPGWCGPDDATQRPAARASGVRLRLYAGVHLMSQRVKRRFERGVELVAVQRLEQAIAQREVLQASAHLGERHVDPGGVELVVELLEHRCRGQVDVR